MSSIFFPMIVDYDFEEYMVVGLADGFNFIAYKVQVPERYDNFVRLLIESCKFKRFVEKCVMCNAPKEGS